MEYFKTTDELTDIHDNDYFPSLTISESKVLKWECIVIVVFYFFLLLLLFLNTYWFVYKQKQYKNLRTDIFYGLSFIVIIARIIYLCAYIVSFPYDTISKPWWSPRNYENYQRNAIVVNISNQFALFGKLIIGFSQLVGTMHIIVDLHKNQRAEKGTAQDKTF